MINTTVNKLRENPALSQTIILVLLIAIAVLALLTANKYLNKEPTVTPLEMQIRQYTAGVNATPNSKDARLALAYAYQKSRDWAKAVEQYNEALKIEPKEMAALYNLGIIAKEQQNYDGAEDFFNQTLALKEDHVLASLALGDLYIKQGKYDEAVQVLDKAIETQGELTDLRILKAQALEKKGDTAGARSEYQEVLRYIPNHAEALKSLERLK